MNEKQDELIEWLLSSRDGQRAVAPFTTRFSAHTKYQNLHGIMRLWDGFTFDWAGWMIYFEGHGSIEFVNVDQGVDFLNSRAWGYAFELQGPIRDGSHSDDFMHVLSRRVARRLSVEEFQQMIESAECPVEIEPYYHHERAVTYEGCKVTSIDVDGDEMSIEFEYKNKKLGCDPGAAS